MCHVCLMNDVKSEVTRRGFMSGAALAAGSGLMLSASAHSASAATHVTATRALDLTHTLTADFPTFFGTPAWESEDMFTYDKDKLNLRIMKYAEHVGTHFDAPLHFSADGASVDEIPVEKLICPLAVIDVKAKAAEDPDYMLTPDDIAAFEAAHGEIPENACVAMNSGWEAHLGSDMFRGQDAEGKLHFPGFHVEAVDFLMRERVVNGIGVDTMSLDPGNSTTSPVHYAWLPSGRYGIENLANLDDLPPLGATLVAGAPKFAGGTGGPGRVMALLA
ncbi:cyclase family protein [Pseudooceanicola sp. C21-150M6]|uniref:cyclase family protein n=1 Tax=Pseudooceanicola sp. C21-150M6 TaxID=3434355 RepID=UPI003D7F9EBF